MSFGIYWGPSISGNYTTKGTIKLDEKDKVVIQMAPCSRQSHPHPPVLCSEVESLLGGSGGLSKWVNNGDN